MLAHTFLKLKNWWMAESVANMMKEIEHLESKHTKIRFDKEMDEVIRIH